MSRFTGIRTLISVFFILLIVLVSCEARTEVAERPERIEKESTETEKSLEKVYDEDAGEGEASLSVSFPSDDSKALYSDHNTSYEYFLLTTEYLSDRRDGSTITGEFDGVKIKAGSDGGRNAVDIGFFTQGRWKFSVKASNSDGDVLYLGSAEAYVTAGKKNAVTITMQENTEEVGRIVIDTMSLTVPLPRVVVSYTKIWNGSGEQTLLDTGADGKGLVMTDQATGYTTYQTPEIIMPSGGYWIKVQLWSGENLFSGEVLDTFIVPRKTTTISGIFTITGLAEFIRVNPNEKYTFCDACSQFEIPTGKMITGFHLLGSTDTVDFPYENRTDTLQYLIPVYEDVTTYFNVSASGTLTKAKAYPYKYAGFNHGYPDSPLEISASLFAGTSSSRNALKAIYSPSTVNIKDSAFAYTNLEEVEFGTIAEIGANAFKGSTVPNFERNSFTNNIKIGNAAFADSGIMYIDIPSGAAVGTGVFQNATDLFRCSIYTNTIPADTFNGCTKLSVLSFSIFATVIGERAFKNCTSIERITLPDALKTIGNNAFENCTGFVKTVTIGSNIKTIGTDAFKGCTNLEELYVGVVCGDIEGDPWGLSSKEKVTYWAYKLYFNSNLPADYVKAEGEEEFPMLLEKNGVQLPTPIADPKYRLIAYNDVVGNTLDGYEIPIPIIDGYALRGWYTDPAAGTEVTQLTVNTIKQNRTVYAHWIRGLLTVVFSGGRGGDENTGKTTETYRMVRYQGYYGYIGEEDEEDDYAKTLPTASIEGRDFIGWYMETEPMIDSTSPDETKQSKLTAVTDKTQVTTKKSHTLYAHYKDHRYTIKFDANLPTNGVQYATRNGTNVYSSYTVPSSYTAVYNQPYNKQWDKSKLSSSSYRGTTVALPDLNTDAYKLDNYYFCGWYLEPECQTKVENTTKVAAQDHNGDTITLYAKWVGKEKTINYVSRYKAYPTDTTYQEKVIQSVVQRFSAPLASTNKFRSYLNKKVVSGSEKLIEKDISFSFPVPTRTGYTFKGWWLGFDDASNKVKGNAAVDGSTTSGTPTEVSSPGTQKIYAEWKANQYTVTFNAQGGSVSPSTKTVTYDSQYGELPVPTRSGYVFTGWYTTSVREGGYGYQNSEACITADSYVRTAGNHTLYAAWSAVIVIAKDSTTPTPLNANVTFDPTSQGGGYGATLDTYGTKTVNIKTVRNMTTKGVKSSSGNWTDAEGVVAEPNQPVTLTASNGYISIDNSITTNSLGEATVTISTTDSSVPGSSSVTLKTVSSSVTAGTISVKFTGKLAKITLAGEKANGNPGNTEVYVRNEIPLKAALSADDNANKYVHYSNTEVTFTVTHASYTDSYEESRIEDSSSVTAGSGLTKISKGALTPKFIFRAGYTKASGAAAVQVKAQETKTGLSATVSVTISKPKETIEVSNGGTVADFFTNVQNLYNASSTAKAQWLVTGFRDWEGGDPASSSAETTVSTTVRNPGATNSTGHTIYLYPIKSAVFASSGSTSESISSAYVAFPTNVSVIGNGSICYSNATKVYIAGSGVTVNTTAFQDNKNSLEIRIPSDASIKEVKSQAFLNCSNLYGITASQFSVMTSIGEEAFKGAGIKTSVTLSKCTSLGKAAFRGAGLTSLNTNITSVEMCYESSVTSVNITASSVANYAFYNCDSLSSITLSGTSSIGEYSFAYCDKNFSINWGNSLTSIGRLAFYVCTGKSSISFPSTLSSMGYAAFAECYALTSVSFSGCSNFKTIPDSCFYNCYNLKSINWGSVTKIANSRAFMKCGFSGDFSIPSQITSIGKQAFADCDKITGLTINARSVIVGQNAFDDCGKLGWVVFNSSSAITIQSEAFKNCGNLYTVDFLAMGSNFNSCSFGSNVWYGCNIGKVRLSRSCFWAGSVDVSVNNTTIKYYKWPVVKFSAWSNCGWWWPHNSWCNRIWVNYNGTVDNRGGGTNSGPFECNKTVYGLSNYGFSHWWHNGSWENSSGSITAWGYGSSEASSVWSTVTAHDYTCGPVTVDYQTSSFSYDNCNNYVYPLGGNYNNSNYRHTGINALKYY